MTFAKFCVSLGLGLLILSILGGLYAENNKQNGPIGRED